MAKTAERSKKPATVISMAPQELQQHPGLLADYIKWKSDPITQMVFGMLRDLAKPNANGTDFAYSMAADKGLTGSMLYSRLVGAQHMLDAAMSFDEIENPEQLDATFGAEQILKDEA